MKKVILRRKQTTVAPEVGVSVYILERMFECVTVRVGRRLYRAGDAISEKDAEIMARTSRFAIEILPELKAFASTPEITSCPIYSEQSQ